MLDLVLLVFAVVYALSGYRQGFIIGCASTAGLLVGGFIGVKVTPTLLDHFTRDLTISVAALVMVLFCAFVGQGVGALAGATLRDKITWRPARIVDSVSGGALSVAAMLLIAWVLGVAASGAQVGGLNREIRGSHVLAAVNGVLPGGADHVLGAFNSLVNASKFPSYLEPFAQERITKVATPSAAVLARPGVRAASASVVKIVGSAASCNQTLEGSGFVVAAEHVMTNAHVVAGVSHPVVTVGDTNYTAHIVYYDPSVDIAVMDVPGLKQPPLRIDVAKAASTSSGAVLGYPENGPFTAQPARIRDEQTLRSSDIYGKGTVYRDTYSIYSQVRQGNSGGPLVNPDGEVIGVVFAASLTDPSTGYALTSAQVSKAATGAADSQIAVSTGACAG